MLRTLAVALTLAALTAPAVAQPKPSAGAETLAAAHGTVDKATADSLTIRPRGENGKYEKDLTLAITGTSKIYTLSMRNTGGKTVAVQTETSHKDLQSKEPVAVIYANGPTGLVLLSAVVMPAK